jgi:hypothetical protein
LSSNTNTETLQALYNKDMTSVYSGGLVYEYSAEGNNYGLVTIKGATVAEGPDFAALQTAFKGTANPSGDGGFNSTGGESICPSWSAKNWDLLNDLLPDIPFGAAAVCPSNLSRIIQDSVKRC